jgi:hypothetical protein
MLRVNAAYVHLLFNTVPPIVNVLGIVVMVMGAVHRNDGVRRIGILLLLLAALAAIPTFLSGKRAEDIVEDLDGVSKTAIEPHEESAELTFTLLCIEGAAALAVLIVFRGARLMPRWAGVVLLVYAVVCTASVFWTASLGGRIHHPETRMVR